MENKDIKTIQTTKGELRYYRDWDRYEGGICMMNPVTIKRYREIQDMQPDADKCGVFFAFSNSQFHEGYDHLVELGHIKKGDKVVQTGIGGMFGTKESIDKFLGFYEDRNKEVAAECDPQEVYFYEYNNHESMIAWDGDLEAIKLIIDLFGVDEARKIKRYNASESIENLVRKPIKVSGLYFLNDGVKETPSSVWFNDQSGLCYTMYASTLYPVCDADGKQYVMPELAGVSAYYDGKKLYKFYNE